jgi:hypothetical protein
MNEVAAVGVRENALDADHIGGHGEIGRWDCKITELFGS